MGPLELPSNTGLTGPTVTCESEATSIHHLFLLQGVTMAHLESHHLPDP